MDGKFAIVTHSRDAAKSAAES
jgi:hypothetical protein